MNPSGLFVTIEGIEGAGKSTAVACVAEWFSSQGYGVVCSREPGGTPVAEDIRRVLLTARDEELAESTELLLMFAARAQHVVQGIRPALAAGKVMICDRFTDSTRAYQGAGRGMDAALIETLAQYAEQGVRPDLTLLLDLPVDVGMTRASIRRGGAAKDRFERETLAFFERVRAGFLRLSAEDPARIEVIDAAESIEAVQAQITDALARRFGSKEPV